MKIRKIFSLLYVSVILLTSCSSQKPIMSFDSKDYIELYDYCSINLDYEYTQITNEDVIRIIETELSVNEAYIKIENRATVEFDDIVLLSLDGLEEYYFVGSGSYSQNFDNELLVMKVGDTKTITDETLGPLETGLLGIYRIATINDLDFILKYYNQSSFEELEIFIRNRAAEEIVFNYVYDEIYEKSILYKFPQEIQNQIDNDIKSCKQEILQQYSDFDDFLSSNELTNDEFENNIVSNYYEIMLYKAILDKEGLFVTQEDISKYKKTNKANYINDYDVFRELAYPKIRGIILSRVQISKQNFIEMFDEFFNDVFNDLVFDWRKILLL